MRRAFTAVLMAAAAIAIAGCAHRGPSTPDEFAVQRNAPLVIPPDFNLTPPVAGTAALSPSDAQQQAIDALFGGASPRSTAETSMLDAADRDSASLGIRSTVGDPTTRVVDKGPTTVQILSAPASNSNIASAQAGQ
ncbi:DUF3035 domain-containing protein [Sphingomonas sp.]|uniref:DUF3035 domain-containing protein n=1 Tax=Sphingomonas sp. TaxID=28214 RepID=UPI0025E4D89A|nr:DUF3035 domain-containing protein [Sphingomonas sp.]MBV9528903.1 DUF3035 domain-containing protein [Sphingomonas sp.]